MIFCNRNAGKSWELPRKGCESEVKGNRNEKFTSPTMCSQCIALYHDFIQSNFLWHLVITWKLGKRNFDILVILVGY